MQFKPILATAPLWATAIVLSLFQIQPASAEMSAKDVTIATRALTFLENAPKGTADLGVIRDPADPSSVKDAETVKTTIGDGLAIGDLTVHARILTPSEVQNATGLAAVLVTGGSPAAFQDVAAAAKSHKLLTITVDPACIKADLCAMLVRSEPKIQVFSNSRIAQQNGVSFSQTFAMMIKEFQ
jgi:hypothetical protein